MQEYIASKSYLLNYFFSYGSFYKRINSHRFYLINLDFSNNHIILYLTYKFFFQDPLSFAK